MNRGSASARTVFTGWLASWLLMLAVSPWWFRDVRIVPALDRSLLNEGRVWQVPLARWAPFDTFAFVPYWLFAALMALLIALVCFGGSGRRWRSACMMTTIALVVTSVLAEPRDLLPATALLMIGRLRHRQWKSLFGPAAASLALLAAVAVTTLEVGLLVLTLCRTLLTWPAAATLTAEAKTKRPSGRAAGRIVLLLLVVLLVIGVWQPNFVRCLLRPFTAALQSPVLFPELNLMSADTRTVLARITALAVMAVLLTRSPVATTSVAARALDIVLVAVAAASGFYTALVTLALVHPIDRSERTVVTSSVLRRWQRLAGWSLVAIVVGTWGLAVRKAGWNALGGSAYADRVDPGEWKFDGRVMLTNLQQDAQWQRPDLRDRFRLLRSGRWDAATLQAPLYKSAVSDLLQGRREFFLTHNGAAGGYRPFLDQYRPVVLVVDVGQLDAIRQLAVDPVWRIVSLDGSRVIFGRNDRPATTAATRRAGQVMQRLEWPRGQSVMNPESVLATGSAEDARRIARVLNAVRLPYAALRIIQEDSSAAAQRVRTWSYVELAHRSRRQAGRPSRIDELRAIRGLNELLDESILTREQEAEIRRALSSLSDDSIQASSTASVEVSLDSSGRSQDRHRFDKLVHRTLEEAPGQMHQSFVELATDPSVPNDVRTEAWFYAGCLALETGQSVQATKSFSAALSMAGSSPFTGLITFYLAQLR